MDRRIVVYEGDKVIYEGPEKRHGQSLAVVEQPKFWGFTIRDIVQIGGIVLAVFAFYLRTDATLIQLVQTNEYLVDFARNSDGWHSAATGREFSQGRPVGNVNTERIRQASEAEAHAGERR